MNKTLVIGPAWVGDMVMSQTLYKLLKSFDPEMVLDVLAPAWSLPLLERMPEVNRGIILPINHGEFNIKLRWQIAAELKREAYQRAYLLPNSWKSALIPFLANIPQRIGWRGEMRWGLLNDLRKLDKQRLPLMIERFMALALAPNTTLPTPYPQPELVVVQQHVMAAKQKFRLENDKKVLSLCPGAEFGPAKRWPEQHYATIANEHLAKGWQVWIFGSDNDSQVAQLIQRATGNQCQDLTGKTSLAEAIDLLSLSNQVVTNDSGLMHIAAALQRPLVAVYGSSDPSFTPPLSDKVKIVSLSLDCSPCFKRQCPLQHLDCLTKLSPNLVLDAITELKAE